MKYLYLSLSLFILPFTSQAQFTEKQKANVDRHIDVVSRPDSTFGPSSSIQVIYKNGEQTLTKDWVELRLMKLGFNIIEDFLTSDIAVINEETKITEESIQSKSTVFTENPATMADYRLSLSFSASGTSTYKIYDYLSLRLTNSKSNALIFVGTFAPNYAFYWKREDVLDRMFQHFESAFALATNEK